MERLPYIDEHARVVGGSPEQVWPRMLRTLRGMAGSRLPAPLATVLAPTPDRATGGWASCAVAPGDTLPGFEVREARAPVRLALGGRHRFSRYRLVFELEEVEPGRTRVRAITWAAFPGFEGRLYRALVIGSRGHRLAVRRILRGMGEEA